MYVTAFETEPQKMVRESLAEATTEVMAGAIGVVHGFVGDNVEAGKLSHPPESTATTQHV